MKRLLRKLLPRRLVAAFLPNYHLLRAVFANITHGFPASNMNVIGVTGTNGKTTTVYYLISILRAAGYRVGYSTSVGSGVDDEMLEEKQDDADAPGTTRDVFALQGLLRQMRRKKVDWVVLEVTSHALSQNRIWGVPIHTAVFTNLTPDHLDYHGTMENYRAAKAKLFQMAKQNTVLNRDDENFEYYAKQSNVTLWTYGRGEDTNVCLVDAMFKLEGSRIQIEYDTAMIRAALHLPGDFNAYNALAATAASLAAVGDIGSETIQKGLESVISLPGRMERLKTTKGFSVVVDYAHTPDAFKQIFASVRSITKGKIIAVFGGHAQHDYQGLGKEAGKAADILIITDDEPEDRDPLAIRQDIILAAQSVEPYDPGRIILEVPDRREGIKKALETAKADDIVLLLCLGHQQYRRINGKKIPWNDRHEAEKILAAKGLLKHKSSI